MHRPWAPLLCCFSAVAATFIHITALRLILVLVAVVLFLIAGVDVARSLMDPDRGPCDPLRPSPKVPITLFQIVLAGVLAAIYTVMMLEPRTGLIRALAS